MAAPKPVLYYIGDRDGLGLHATGIPRHDLTRAQVEDIADNLGMEPRLLIRWLVSTGAYTRNDPSETPETPTGGTETAGEPEDESPEPPPPPEPVRPTEGPTGPAAEPRRHARGS